MPIPGECSHMAASRSGRSEEHTSEFQSPCNLVCRLLLEKKKINMISVPTRTFDDSDLDAILHNLSCVSYHVSRSLRIDEKARPLSACDRVFFFFNDTATTEIYTLSLHDPLPI